MCLCGRQREPWVRSLCADISGARRPGGERHSRPRDVLPLSGWRADAVRSSTGPSWRPRWGSAFQRPHNGSASWRSLPRSSSSHRCAADGKSRLTASPLRSSDTESTQCVVATVGAFCKSSPRNHGQGPRDAPSMKTLRRIRGRRRPGPAFPDRWLTKACAGGSERACRPPPVRESRGEARTAGARGRSGARSGRRRSRPDGRAGRRA